MSLHILYSPNDEFVEILSGNERLGTVNYTHSFKPSPYKQITTEQLMEVDAIARLLSSLRVEISPSAKLAKDLQETSGGQNVPN